MGHTPGKGTEESVLLRHPWGRGHSLSSGLKLGGMGRGSATKHIGSLVQGVCALAALSGR